jgi:uncharacterized protein YkwD
MKSKALWALGAFCFCAAGIVVYGPPAHSQTPTAQASNTFDLSAPEKEVLAEINEVRAHPDKYASYLEGLKPFFKDKEFQPKGQPPLTTEEGWNAVDDAIKFLRNAKPQAPLGVSRGLCLAASTHMKEQSGSGATGHKSADSGMIENRVKPFGTWDGAIGENLSYGTESARDRILVWLIDDGVATRGHRKRLLSPDYKVAGLSCGAHPEFGSMCVLTLAGAFSDLQPSKAVTGTVTQPVKRQIQN